MKAIRYHRYDGPEVLALRDIDLPVVGDEDILVQVKATSVNPLDYHFLRGTPYLVRILAGLTRPRANGLGADLAGCVEAVGRNVTKFRPGDEVFGTRDLGARAKGGTFAEYVSVHQDGPVCSKPANLTYEQAAAVPPRRSPPCRRCATKATSGPGTGSSSTAPRAAWARSRYRSPRRTAPR
jgi:NADPH:quinone reductase-like Zn-dependent oxidoreductase